MAKNYIQTVVNVSRTGLSICSSNSPAPATLNFPPTAIKDLEVINQTEINNLVKTLLASHQVKPTSLVLILSSQVYFQKSLHEVPETKRAEETQTFLDSVPLSSLSYKAFRVQNKEYLIVINRNLYESLKQAFSALGFSIAAVVPEIVFGDNPTQFSAETCRLVFKKMDFLLQNSFLQDNEPYHNFQRKEQAFLKKYQTLLIILCTAAIGFAGFMVYIRYQQATKPPVRSPRTKPTSMVRPTVAPTIIPVASPSAVLLTLTAQVLNASGTPGAATKLVTKYQSLGLVSVKVGNSTQSTASTVGFSTKVSSTAREYIIKATQEVYPTLRLQEVPVSGGFDIVIIVGKQ